MPINSFLYPGPSNSNPYVVDNSCMFNDGDSAFLSKTFSGDGTSHDIGTVSFWLKRGELGAEQGIFTAGASTRNFIRIESNDTLTFRSVGDSFHLQTTQVFRDPSSWYSIIIAWDTSQGTASDRVNFYVNGTQVTAFGTATYPAQNLDIKLGAAELNCIGKDSEQTTPYFDGYLSEFVYIDGQQLTPTSFGEFDADSPTIFKPKAIALTFGTNGFYLDFEDSGDLGDDESGNGNDFAETNLAATDQASDSPTNNFCTLNPLTKRAGGTLSEGNLKYTAATTDSSVFGTIGIPPGMKVYFEVKLVNNTAQNAIGIHNLYDGGDGAFVKGGSGAGTYSYKVRGGSTVTQYYNNGSSTDTSISNYSNDTIIGVAVDNENGQIHYSADGTYINSSDPTDNDPVALVTGFGGASEQYIHTSLDTTTSMPSNEFNFGNPPFSISSGNADADGYGNFEYAVPSGYYALCTKNLAEYG